MKPITKVVSEWTDKFFGHTNIEISDDENRSTYRFAAKDKEDFEYRGFVEVYENRPGILVFLYSPFKVPKQYRHAVAEVLVLINYGLESGAIGMDMNDGEIRYKVGLDVKDGAMSVTMVNELVDRGTSIMDQCLPAIAAVSYAGQSPDQAYAQAVANIDETNECALQTTAIEKTTARLWNTILGNEPIRAWSEDLKSALSSKGDMRKWEMAGRAAIIINDDKNYCREILQRVAEDNNIQFIAISTSDVMEMAPPSGLKNVAPALVYLEPGRWMRSKTDADESEKKTENVRQFQNLLSDYLLSFNPDSPIIYVTSINRLDTVASRLMRVGHFERFLSIPDEDIEVMGEVFLNQIGEESCSDELKNSARKIGKLLKYEIDDADKRKLSAFCLRREFNRKKKPLEFIDLVHAICHGLQEEGQAKGQTDEMMRQVAVHEAGHAVVAAIDSGGKNIPEYTSIIPSVSFQGIVIESYSFHFDHDEMNTYRDFCHDIRICLAGRAAEEVAFGVQGVSSGCKSDLDSASRSASKAFAYWGFAPQMDITGRSGSNLAAVFGSASDSEMQHVETLSRDFLEMEYEAVKNLLESNRDLLDKVTNRLLVNPILDQIELEFVVNEHLRNSLASISALPQ
jgi:cell division protease FtsH